MAKGSTCGISGIQFGGGKTNFMAQGVQMTQTYPKPWKSYQEQLDQLIARGMTVTDRDKALDYLERIGYYRLSGYWFAFRERTELCCPLDPHTGKRPRKTSFVITRKSTVSR
ncbi:hypothetical protein VF673_12025 [Halopseudomonas sp. Lyrl_26]|uniref:hypothetical protein n=1 Tax=Halopseudomonas sp. Lyrl_26 TaxID=3110923 RepID=UPI003F80B85C